jgi:comEA protein
VNIGDVKKITYADFVIVLGFCLIVLGLGIKMRGVLEITNNNIYGGVDKISKPLEVIVNINTASITELEVLPSIGPKTAQKIIDYRNKWGKFGRKEDIKKVSGIGQKTYEKIMDKIEI